MRLAVSVLTVSAAAAFQQTTTRQNTAWTLHSSAYESQYQNFAERGGPGIEPMMPQPPAGPMELYDRPSGGALRPDTGMDDERNYGFRVYRDSRRMDGEPLAPDFNGRERPFGRGYGSDADRIQGNSLRTYGNYGGSNTVDLRTEGRDMYANLEMWAGPDNTAQQVSLYSQDGSQYGVRTTMSTTQQNSIAIRNQGDLQFPLEASVTSRPLPERFSPPDSSMRGSYGRSEVKRIQGEGMSEDIPIPAEVQSIRVVLESEGTPINANVELLQGPNNIKVLGDIYNDGIHGPFEAEIDTPGLSGTLRITNTGPMAYPIRAYIEPTSFGDPRSVYNQNQRSRFGPEGRFNQW